MYESCHTFCALLVLSFQTETTNEETLSVSSSGDEAGNHQPVHVVEVQGIVQRFLGEIVLL